MKYSILEDIKTSAQGQWRSKIFPILGIEIRPDGRHEPCPYCGGTDRFRCDDKDGHGTWFCNQCVPRSGDGFALAGKCLNLSFPEALQRVGELVGVPFTSRQARSHHRPVYRPANLSALNRERAVALKKGSHAILDLADRRYEHAKKILETAQSVSIDNWSDDELEEVWTKVGLAYTGIQLCDSLQDLSFDIQKMALDLEHNRER